MTTLAEQKALMRRDTVARVLGLDPELRADEELGLRERFIKLPRLVEAKTVLLYVSAFPEEIDTKPLLTACLELGKQLVLPRVHRASRTLSLHRVASLENDLAPGYWGIPEPRKSTLLVDPSQIDWVLVPGLAFDGHLQRLGRGAGHYDRLLPNLKADAFKAALILEAQWVDEVPAEPHDVALDAVVSCSRAVFGPQFA